VRTATVERSGKSAALVVDVTAPAQAGDVALFAAAPDGSVGVPQPATRGRWRIPLLGDTTQRKVELVLAAGSTAIAVPVALDAGTPTP
jgi:hypothetical protein